MCKFQAETTCCKLMKVKNSVKYMKINKISLNKLSTFADSIFVGGADTSPGPTSSVFPK